MLNIEKSFNPYDSHWKVIESICFTLKKHWIRTVCLTLKSHPYSLWKVIRIDIEKSLNPYGMFNIEKSLNPYGMFNIEKSLNPYGMFNIEKSLNPYGMFNIEKSSVFTLKSYWIRMFNIEKSSFLKSKSRRHAKEHNLCNIYIRSLLIVVNFTLNEEHQYLERRHALLILLIFYSIPTKVTVFL